MEVENSGDRIFGEAESVLHTENHYYLVRVRRLDHLKQAGKAVKAQATTLEQSKISIVQQYRWHMLVGTELKKLWIVK